MSDALRSFVSYVHAQKAWSERTFGPGTREKGVIDHIRKELEEIGNAVTPAEKLAEWIDVIILAIDGAGRTGATPAEVAEALSAKQTKNFGRVWPDWRTMSEDQAIEHDRSVDLSGLEAEVRRGEQLTEDARQRGLLSTRPGKLSLNHTDDCEAWCRGDQSCDCGALNASNRQA